MARSQLCPGRLGLCRGTNAASTQPKGNYRLPKFFKLCPRIGAKEYCKHNRINQRAEEEMGKNAAHIAMTRLYTSAKDTDKSLSLKTHLLQWVIELTSLPS